MKKTFPLLALLLVILTACPRKQDIIDSGNGDKKIGYLFYTDFINNYNSSLKEAFVKFKTAGVTDLIIDLRYNHGGDLDAAGFLASLIAPRSAVQSRSLFTQLDFNTLLNAEYDRNGWSRKFTLGGGALDPLSANLNLSTVYIIATDDSYSASELLTFCLRPYMKVVHVGGNTGGKFTASMTVAAYDSYGGKLNTIYNPNTLTSSAKDSLKDWAMQPIVAIYKDSKGADFSAAATLVPDVPVESRETDLSSFKSIGDPADYLLAATIAKITGTPVSASTVNRSVSNMKPANLFLGIGEVKKDAVIWRPVRAQSAGTLAAGINTVSQFVYDGMSVFYRWNTSMTTKRPTVADQDPKQYFSSVLYPLDAQHGWSWITNDVNALLNDFQGTPVAFGWGLSYLWADATRTKLVAIVNYVFPNTPAANAGIKRGELISKINGLDITNNATDNGYYLKLAGGSPVTISIGNGSASRSVSLTPVTIAANPVLKDTIYTFKK